MIFQAFQNPFVMFILLMSVATPQVYTLLIVSYFYLYFALIIYLFATVLATTLLQIVVSKCSSYLIITGTPLLFEYFTVPYIYQVELLEFGRNPGTW